MDLGPGTPLCRLDDIAEPGAKGFVFGEGAARLELFLVRTKGVVRGFLNACPHQGTPLETFPDKFLTTDGKLIICSNHGARFRPEDGVCVSGPCKGKALTKVAVTTADGVVALA